MLGEPMNLVSPWKDRYLVTLVARAKRGKTSWFRMTWDDRLEVLRSKRLITMSTAGWLPRVRFTQKGHRQITVPVVLHVATAMRVAKHQLGIKEARQAIRNYLIMEESTPLTVAKLQPKIVGLLRRLSNYKAALKHEPLSYNAALTIYRSAT